MHSVQLIKAQNVECIKITEIILQEMWVDWGLGTMVAFV